MIGHGFQFAGPALKIHKDFPKTWINECAAKLRSLGGAVIWVNHANVHNGSSNDWEMFFDYFVSADIRQETIESLSPEGNGQKVWRDLKVEDDDLHVVKNRYSAFIPGSSSLEQTLRSRGITNLLIAGTKTNVCCEATGRDAMMLDFRVVMVKDCLGALSDDEHLAALETFIQQFGDVMSASEVLDILGQQKGQSDS